MVLTPTVCAAIRLTSCPSLRTPPNEVVSRGVESVKAYLKRLAGGFTECRRTKLMFVGLGGAGKTRWGLVCVCVCVCAVSYTHLTLPTRSTV